MDITQLAETAALLGNKMGEDYKAETIEHFFASDYGKTRVLRETLVHLNQTKQLLNNSEQETLKDVVQEIDELTRDDEEYWGKVKVLFSDKIEELVVSYFQDYCSGTVWLNKNEIALFQPDFSRNVHVLWDIRGRETLFQDFSKIMEAVEQYVEDYGNVDEMEIPTSIDFSMEKENFFFPDDYQEANLYYVLYHHIADNDPGHFERFYGDMDIEAPVDASKGALSCCKEILEATYGKDTAKLIVQDSQFPKELLPAVDKLKLMFEQKQKEQEERDDI